MDGQVGLSTIRDMWLFCSKQKLVICKALSELAKPCLAKELIRKLCAAVYANSQLG